MKPWVTWPLLPLVAFAALQGGGAFAWAGKTAPAPRYALLAGGTEDKGEGGFLVKDLKDLRRALVARHWQVDAVVGARPGLLPGSRQATNANLMSAVGATLARARKGEQVLLLFHAHGREREKGWGQRSHSLVSEDRDASGNDPGFDLDALEPGLLEAKARGVRVALMDLSCYSGASQALRGPDCTATLAAPRYVSLCSGRATERLFTSRFFQLPGPGTAVDLESQFLTSRREDLNSINLPELSSRPTPGRDAWDEFLVDTDPLDIFEDLKELRTGAPVFAPEKLLEAIDAAIAASGAPGAPVKAPVASLRAELASRLTSVLALRRKLEEAMPGLAREYDEPRIPLEVPGRDPVTLSPGNLTDLLKKLHDYRSPEAMLKGLEGYTEVQRRLMAAIWPVRAGLHDRHFALLDGFAKRRDDFEKLEDDLADTTGSLFEIERRLYDSLSPPEPKTNPCRDFSL